MVQQHVVKGAMPVQTLNSLPFIGLDSLAKKGNGRSPIPDVDAIVEIGVLHDVVVFDREGIIGERSSSFPGASEV